MPSKRNLLLVTVAAGLGLAATSAGAAGTFVPVVPFPNSTQTSAFGINDKNIVTGDYTDSSGLTHGFIGPFSGSKYKSFDDPDGTTQPRAISDSSITTGFDTGTLVPWERTSKGKLTDITKGGKPIDQLAQGLNSKGVFAGNYTNSKTGLSTGYLGQSSKYKSAIKLSIKNNGYAGRGIDTAGDVVGWYYDTTTGLQHGYIIVGGKASTIDFPSATYTVMEGLNDKGVASGQFQDASGVIHGFTYTVKTKKMVQLDAPGSTLTQAWGINNNDVVAISSSAGSFAYCMKTTGCPTAADVAQHPVGKYVPAKP